ncbi:MAG TPA: DUF1549 domain-containing protein [Bryobacteraceae bacterium]|nr:DUF1549 domain-containing protein [Bryobacteraceae bacterium]
MFRPAILAFLPLALCAQAVSPEAEQNIEKAHESLLKPKVKASKGAESLTTQTAPLRPAKVLSGPITRKNFIDEHIFGRMEKDRIPHSSLAADEEFARRAWLDATGRIPPVADLTAFLQDKDPNKRDKLVDRLVDSEDFVSRWAYYFEDLFRAGNRMGFGANLFHYWIEEWLRLDRPYSEVVQDLLSQGGKSSHSSPGALYFARDFVKAKDDPEEKDAHDLVNRADSIDEFTITYSKVFLGINIGCISCHDGRSHLEQVNLFLTSKKRSEFFQQAAFYGKTRMIMNWENGFQANTEYTVDDVVEEGYPTKGESIVRVPRTGGPNQPAFILTGETAKPGVEPRDELGRMLTADIQFARATTNRIWAEFMGFGIVEPIDDFDLNRYYPDQPLPKGWTVQPSNPYLLDAMAKDFQKSNFSFKHLVRTIMKSSAYQLSSRFEDEWRPEYASYYARKFVRMLSPTQLQDALYTATARTGSFGSRGKGAAMSMELLDPAHATREVAEMMRAFGQVSRDEMPKRAHTSSLQAMLMMNSKVVLDRVKAEGNSQVEQLLKVRETERPHIAKSIEAAKKREAVPAEIELALDRSLVTKLYLATLSRDPLEAEVRIAMGELERDRKKGLENLQWALLNSPEFLFNY